MNLKHWLNEERGRYTALAAELGVSVGRVSQMADDGVPPKYMLAVRAFTKDAVSLESLVQDRTASQPDADPAPEPRPTSERRESEIHPVVIIPDRRHVVARPKQSKKRKGG
jgi:hypothetical protein